jgi:PAS domain-containing protein
MSATHMPSQYLMSAPPSLHREAMLTPEDINQGFTLAGTILAILTWLWRHSIKAGLVWVKDAFSAPGLIRQQNEVIAKLITLITEARHTANFAVATARIAWSFVERPVMQFNSLGECVCVNDFSMRAFVRQQDEFLGKGWLSMVHHDDVADVRRLWEAAVADKRNFTHEFRIHHRDGRIIRVYDRAEIMHDTATDEVLGWHHLMSIITD